MQIASMPSIVVLRLMASALITVFTASRKRLLVTFNLIRGRYEDTDFLEVKEFDMSKAVVTGSVPPLIAIFVAGIAYSLSILLL
jgi:hypothetical protein